MPAALLAICFFWALVAWDPMGYYHTPPYQPPTPTEELQNQWWAANFAASLAGDPATHDSFLASERERISLECILKKVDPTEVFR